MLRVFEKKVLRKIFGPKMDEVTWHDKLNDLYTSPNIILVTKSRRIRWVGYIACMGGEERCIQGFERETTWKIQAQIGR